LHLQRGNIRKKCPMINGKKEISGGRKQNKNFYKTGFG
jgi:hypothetical protein